MNNLLDKNSFVENIKKIAILNSLDINSNYLNMLYHEVCEIFSNEEFELACKSILSKEKLYNKPPTLEMFIRHSGKKMVSNEDKLKYEKQIFLNKVGGYLAMDFVTSYEKEELFSQFNNFDNHILNVIGGLSKLWEQVHNETYPKSISNILKDLGDIYETNYHLIEIIETGNYTRIGFSTFNKVIQKTLKNICLSKKDDENISGS